MGHRATSDAWTRLPGMRWIGYALVVQGTELGSAVKITQSYNPWPYCDDEAALPWPDPGNDVWPGCDVCEGGAAWNSALRF